MINIVDKEVFAFNWIKRLVSGDRWLIENPKDIERQQVNQRRETYYRDQKPQTARNLYLL